MQIHFLCTTKKVREDLTSEDNGQRQTDCSPNRETTANRFPIEKKIGLRDAHQVCRIFIGRYANDVMMASFADNAVLGKPCIDTAGIGQRFSGRKGFGRDNDQCRTRIALSQNAIQSNSVGCRQKVQTNGYPFHQRVIHRTHTGFRSTDPYVDDIQNALSGKTAPSAVADLVGKIKHPIALDQNR